MTDTLQWLLESDDEPWTRYRTLVDLLDQPEDDPEVLSRFPFVHGDPRFREMTGAITAQADAASPGQSRGEGRYTATSMYRAWKGWSFADKKHPSPWLTFLVLRILKRLNRR
jgi:hypothetical protein